MSLPLKPVSKSQELVLSIDLLISKHGKDHPELLQDLLKLRDEVTKAHRKGNALSFAVSALRIAQLVKFIFDHLPPPH